MRRKILFVSHIYPWPLDNGTVQRVYHLIHSLAQRHDVTLVTLYRRGGGRDVGSRMPLHDTCERVIEVDDATCPFRQTRRFDEWAPAMDRVRALVSSPFPSQVQAWRSPALLAVLQELHASQRFDAVWVERLRLAETVRQAGFTKFVLDLDMLEGRYLREVLRRAPWYFSKPLHYLEWLKLDAYERRAASRFSRLVVCHDDDRQFFERHRDHVFVVPNGVEPWEPSDPESVDPREILFVGTMSYEPNIDAVRFFMESVDPLIRASCAEAHLSIVGKEPDASVLALHDGQRCTVHGRVPDVTPYFDKAAVVVAPMRIGGGTLLKVLESLGRGKAVVATSVAIHGLDLRPGVDLEIADTPEALAAACVRLLGDPEARRRLGAAGRARVLERYAWETSGQTAERVLIPEGLPS